VVPQPVVQLMAVLQQAVLAALALRVARLTAVPQRMEPVDSRAQAEQEVQLTAHQAATPQAVLVVLAEVPAAQRADQQPTVRR
jgi:hypothetical protein